MALTDFQELVDDLVRDDSGQISTTDRDAAIETAVRRYSQDRPQIEVEDLTSADGKSLALPATWEDGFSQVQSLEYPIGERPPALLENRAWQLYKGPAATTIMLIDGVPAGEDVRTTFTIAHVLDGASDTIPAKDREAVGSYAAAQLLEQLANFHAGTKDSTLNTDSVNHGSMSSDYARRARERRQYYFDALGIDPKRNVAAGVVVDLDLDDSLGGDRLTHPRRRR